MPSRPLRTIASATSTLALVAAGIAATTTVSHAAPGDVNTTLCPGTPIWTGELTEGQEVTGKTTVKGTEVDTFQGTYIDTQVDPFGNDVYLFKLSGSRITNGSGGLEGPAGIWAGISGSPVYDADNNLIGSVSYSFTSEGSSDIAGVTPAENIIATDPDAPVATPVTAAKTVPLSASVQRSIAAADSTPAPALRQLTLPRVVVGAPKAPGKTPGQTATAFADKSRTLPKAVTLAEAGATSNINTIEPGGNIATSWSYGDVLLASVGTVTAVCGAAGGDKVFAFGHPDEYVGKSTQTFLSASTTRIMTNGSDSYKMVNIDPVPAGTLTQDRTNGVMGILGGTPGHATTVSTTTTVGTKTQSHETTVTTPYALSLALATQTGAEVQYGLNQYSSGEALMTWSINYTPRGGVPATYTRTQRISATGYFPEEAPYDVASDVEFLQSASDTKVAINSVTVNTQLFPDYNALRISQIDVRSAGKWVKVKNGTRIPARRGRTFPVQVHLVPANGDSVATPVVKRLDQTISTAAYGTGYLTFSGGRNYYDDFEDFTIDIDEEDEDFYYDEEESLTLAQVLAALKAQVRNDSARSNQGYFTKYGSPRVSRRTVETPAVTSGSAYIRLSYRS